MLGNYFRKRYKDLSVKNKKKVSAVPKNALIELTNVCNHACVFCTNPMMKRKNNSLDFKVFANFIKKSVDEGLEEVGLYSTGEPFMTKDLHNYIASAKELGIKRVYITTNGALATFDKVIKCINAGLDSIKFSINAGTRETYKIIHGYDDFDKVIKNIDDIYNYKLKYKINLTLFASFVVTNLTKNQTEIFTKKYGKYFDDMLIQNSRNQGGRTLSTNEKIISQIKTNGSNAFAYTKDLKTERNEKNLEKSKLTPCGMLWDRMHLSSEGYLTACCEDYENDLVYEKFDNKKTIFSQFNNKYMQDLREKHLEGKLEGTICKGCLLNKKYEYKKLTDIEVKENKPNIRKANSLKIRILKATNNG